MKQDTDFGASSAVAFILIIAALVLLAGTWAVVVLPDQIHEAEEEEMQNAINTLIDTKLMMNAAAENGLEVTVHRHLPKGSLLSGESGTLFINGEPIPVRYLLLETGGASTGITADGVWRKDRDSAAWVLLPQSASDGKSLTFEILTCKETLAYGSSEMIAFSFSHEETRTHQISDASIFVTFDSESQWMEGLLQTFFQEMSYQHELCKTSGDGLIISAETGNVTLTVTEHLYSVRAGGFA